MRQILSLIPPFEAYREPMVGGGSVFLALRQLFPRRHFWINDLNYELYCFWAVLQSHPENLMRKVLQIYEQAEDGRELFTRLMERYDQGDELERAVRFFVLNRITFSGTVDSGGYSEQAFKGRFTLSAIRRLAQVAPLLQGVRITHGDYEAVLRAPGEGVFIFLDPPYYSATASRLYGRRGELHTGFDHQRLSHVLRETSHRWLLTYDDSPFIRQLYGGYSILSWRLQYGMNNYKQSIARPGQELFIANYSLETIQVIDSLFQGLPPIS